MPTYKLLDEILNLSDFLTKSSNTWAGAATWAANEIPLDPIFTAEIASQKVIRTFYGDTHRFEVDVNKDRGMLLRCVALYADTELPTSLKDKIKLQNHPPKIIYATYAETVDGYVSHFASQLDPEKVANIEFTMYLPNGNLDYKWKGNYALEHVTETFIKDTEVAGMRFKFLRVG